MDNHGQWPAITRVWACGSHTDRPVCVDNNKYPPPTLPVLLNDAAEFHEYRAELLTNNNPAPHRLGWLLPPRGVLLA